MRMSKAFGAKKIFSYWWTWAAIGLIIAGCTICAAVHVATESIDKNGSLRSPQYEVDAIASADISFEAAAPHTADEGIVKIASGTATAAEADNQTAATAENKQTRQSNVIDDPEKIWADDKVVTYNSFTEPDKIIQEDGSLGVLTIPRISLNVNIFEAENEIEAMTHGIAHFKNTTSWDGNIGLCGHNVNYDLTNGYFKNLHQLEKGDLVQVSTALGVRTYSVETVKEIAETDWSGLNRTSDNRVTMITCISGKPALRLMVQAVEKK